VSTVDVVSQGEAAEYSHRSRLRTRSQLVIASRTTSAVFTRSSPIMSQIGGRQEKESSAVTRQ
jgi:hypothetical protein